MTTKDDTRSEKPKRKPWRKKSPEELVLQQEERLRREITKLEAEISEKRELLTKFEQARAIFQSD